MTWTDEQIDRYVEDSFQFLEEAQDRLQKDFGIGQYNRWDLDQETSALSFSDLNRPTLHCSVYALGTFGGGVWKWAWSNPSLIDSFSSTSRKMRELAAQSGLDIFEKDEFEADENMPWEICGMALREIGGLGVYRCPAKTSDLFVVITTVSSNQ